MKKKIALFLVASAVALSFSACGKNASDIDSVSEEQVAVVEETTEVIAKAEVTEPEATEVEVEATVEEIEVEITEETAAEETTAEEKVEEPPVEEAKEEAKEETPKVTIPDWFDAAYYAANNADVVAALGSSPEALYNHYTQFGKAEGRAAYEGDPNASKVADAGAGAVADSSNGQVQTATGDWWDGLPWHEWIDLGDCFVYIDCHRPAPGICPDELNYNATDGMIAELENRGYSTACSGSNHYKGVELAVVTPWEGDNGFYAPWW